MEQEAAGLLSLLPLVILHIPLGIVMIMLAKRKGHTSFWWKIIGFVPVIGWYPLWYLVGITDKAVYDKLDEINGALKHRIE